MPTRIALYVTSVVVLAIAAVTALFAVAPDASAAPLKVLVLLSIFAFVAEALALMLPRSASTSVASVPYLAAALITPTWPGAVSVIAAALASQLMHRRGVVKAVFNIAQMTLAISMAMLLYRILGGQPLLDLASASFFAASVTNGLPALALLSTYYVANKLLVYGVIALSERRSLSAVWRQNSSGTIAYDFLSGPFVFLFAWTTVKLGPLGAALLALPTIGLRHLFQTTLELERTHQDLLELMVKAMEARDPYTSGHSRRVQHYSMVIARAVGLSDREIERVGVAALLHDVGKIHEKYAPILQKPDRLTAEEWAIMEQHPVDSAELVATVSRLKDIVPHVRHHHERWDGAGYPDRLAGEAIPLAARIITFADTIDAMTTARPYRGPLSEDAVRAELVKCRGKQFDPQICDTLLQSPLWSLLFAPKPKPPEVTLKSRFRVIPLDARRALLG